jgi:alpha-amylase
MARGPAAALCLLLAGCGPRALEEPAPSAPAAAAPDAASYWNAATVYFLLIDRFHNGNPANDTALGRRKDGALLRNFEGGDLAGVLEKIEAGWFDSLGVTAIWMTPFVEQIHAGVDEGTGRTYGYHGYWTRDWTAVDPALGTIDELRAVVDAAHSRGIRVLMDAVLNHPGPVTPQDPAWPASWVRTQPQCTYRDYVTTVTCTLVPTLPDVLTESDAAVELPPALVEKWRREGRLEQEQADLDAFFRRTGYPRAPRYYIIKWLTDWVRELGFDGYRVDTAKHIEEAVSAALRREADAALAEWRRSHRSPAPDNLGFYMMGEVYGYALGHGRSYSFGDRAVDFFAHGYDALINFGFKAEAAGPMDSVFARYATALHGPLRGVAVLNYISSHDDGGPLDPERRDPMGAGTRLLLAPGGAQIYYGDELARPLRVAGAAGDANLRSFMNWESAPPQGRGGVILWHWRQLGRFRRAHPAVGAGEHRRLQEEPYLFSRTLERNGQTDRVLVGIGVPEGQKTLPVYATFPSGTQLVDEYTGTATTVVDGRVSLSTPYPIVLLAPPRAAAPAAGPAPNVQVFVANNSPYQMEIYAEASGASYRMGTVDPGNARRFILRPQLLGSGGNVRFWAQATGRGPSVTPASVQLRPGYVVDFAIAPFLNNSEVTVRP